MKKQKILITGAAGFIGYWLCKKLLDNKNNEVVGLDNLNSYYSVKLKKERIKELKKAKNFIFLKLDLLEKKKLNQLFQKKKFNFVYNLAAQAGVRYSFENPESYCDSNIIGFNNILNLVEKFKVKKLFFASSSSVYGDIGPFPKKENSKLNTLNIYSLSKLANEITAKLFAKKSKTQIIGLRFFSIYGEWGRPDMLIYKYLKSVFDKKSKFYLNNYGNHTRDFTYINDVIEILYKLLNIKFTKNNNVINICSNNPIKITKILNHINDYFKKRPLIYKRSFQKADVKKTHGSNLKIKKLFKKKRFTDLNLALTNTCSWFKKNSKLFI